jgi:serine/threonine protein kinase
LAIGSEMETLSMALDSGTELGPYVVSSLLGSGGMGDVYRARDTRLARDVAIKVLPRESALSVDRRARFEREAKAVAALSHPNVLAIFDTGVHDGQMYLVTELLNGETLRAALQSGPLSVRKSIDVAVQIARGLAAAHDRGIVHRDLKPENVFVLPDGQVKILDFGLAREIVTPSGSTQTAGAVTDPGSVMGTVGYMAPEQVRGLDLDGRADLFALGTVLYEMLSGKRAFQADTAADTMFAIVKQEPPALLTIRPEIPPTLDRIVRHCLEKNPLERFQSARDIAFVLEALSGSSIPTVNAVAEPVHSVPSRQKPIAVFGMIFVVFVAAFWMGRRSTPTPASNPIRFDMKTFDPETIFNARFAPDGQTIIFSAALRDADPQLFVVRPGALLPQKFGPPRTHLLSVSSKGELAVLTDAHHEGLALFTGTLSRMTMDGEPRQWLDLVREADWSPDGSTLAVVRYLPNGRDQLEYPIGTVLYQTTGLISDPRVSPDGSRVAFMDHPAKSDNRGFVKVVDRSHHVTTLAGEYRAEHGVAWNREGTTVYFSAPDLQDEYQVFAASENEQATREALFSIGSLQIMDVGPNARSLVTKVETKWSIRALLPGATEEREFPWLNNTFIPMLDHDGKLLVFTDAHHSAGPTYSVAMRRTDGSPAVRLGEGNLAGLSPDGKWAAALVAKPPKLVAYPTGVGEPLKFDVGNIEAYTNDSGSSFPDSRRFVKCGNEPGRLARCYLHTAGASPRPITPEGTFSALVSPDGKSIAALFTDESVRVWNLDGGEARAVPGLNWHEEYPLAWSDDGKALLVVGATMPKRLERLDLANGTKTLIRSIAPSDRAGLTELYLSSVVADGRYYAYTYGKFLSSLAVVTGMR